MSRLIMIGVDGMDADFVEEHHAELPNLHRLRREGTGTGLKSVFPSDSIPAWITIFTGIPPVEHGILDAVDYFAKDRSSFAVDTSVFQDRTFWDVASQEGKRVCIINPFMAYPPWTVNGVMTSGPVFVDAGKEMAYPPDLQTEMQLPAMGGIVDFPTKESLAEFRDQTRRYTEAQHSFSMELLDSRGPWDLFFSTYLTLDRIQHFYWRFHDSDDPTYPGPNEYSSVVMDSYRHFDRIVGDYLDRCDGDTHLLVVSDHGHGRRCTKLVNVNEYLRRKGWIATRGGQKNPFHPRRVLQRTKTVAMEALDRLDMADHMQRVVKAVPVVRELKKGSFLVDESANLVFTPRFAGTNPCGGVSINPEALAASGRTYEEVRDQLIHDLMELTDEGSDRKLFRWVKRREDYLGSGSHLGKFPDVLFLLEKEYGVGWDLFGDVVAVNPTHRKISGGHKIHGVFYTTLRKTTDTTPELHDIAPLVLRTLGIAPRPWMQAGSDAVASAE